MFHISLCQRGPTKMRRFENTAAPLRNCEQVCAYFPCPAKPSWVAKSRMIFVFCLQFVATFPTLPPTPALWMVQTIHTGWSGTGLLGSNDPVPTGLLPEDRAPSTVCRQERFPLLTRVVQAWESSCLTPLYYCPLPRNTTDYRLPGAGNCLF